MKEQSSIERLERFAKDNHLDYQTNRDVKKHLFNTGNLSTKYEFLVIDLLKNGKKLHLVFSDFRVSRGGGSFAYCGLFNALPKCKNELKIRKRFFTDKLSVTKSHKTGNDFIDKKVSIFKSNNESLPIILDTEIIRRFLALNKTLGPLELITENKSMSFIPLLYNKHWLAITISRRWLTEPDELNTMIDSGGDLLQKIKLNS